MRANWKWLKDFGFAVMFGFAAIGFTGTIVAVSAGTNIKACPAEDCHLQGWIGVVSGSLATIFALLAVVVAMQALRTQRKGSEAELRAYIVLDKAELDTPRDSIDVAFRNCGATPALDLEILLDLQTLPGKSDETEAAASCLYKMGVIGPDRFFTLDWSEITIKQREHLFDLHAGNKHMCIGGRVDYSDVFGTRHRLAVQVALTSNGTSFRQKLDVVKQKYEDPSHA